MKRTTLIKRVRKAGRWGLDIKRLGAKDASVLAVVDSLVSDGVLVRYSNPYHRTTWIRLPLATDNIEEWRTANA